MRRQGPDPARRRLLRGDLFGGPLTHAQRAGEPLGPPPPALGWARLDQAPCAGCVAGCAAACAPGIVRLHPLTHPLAGVPYLSFEQAGCTFCEACVEACPLERPAGEALAALGRVRLDERACLVAQGVMCMGCQLACSTGALRLIGARLSVEPAHCTGCGACVSVCPADAISVVGPPPVV